jgi:hypothetical protein
MDITFARSSSMSQWKYCQMSTFITYNLGVKQPSNYKSNWGTIVHKTLEVLAVCKKIIQSDHDKKINFIDSELGPIEFTEKSLYSKKFVKHIFDLSFKHYADSDPNHKYTKEEYEICEGSVNTCLYEYKGHYDPRNMNIVQPERSFEIEVPEPWAKLDGGGQLMLKGTMDLVTESCPDTLHYVDYKNGARKDWATGKVKDYKYLNTDFQLLMYHYCLRKLYPQYKYIIMTILFLREGGPFTLCYEDDHIEMFLNELKARFNEIKDCKQPRPINKNRTDFRCTRLCHYYKNNWPGTDKRICNHVEDTIKTYGIGVAQKKLIQPGHSIDYYAQPGSTDK